ncbi:putative membrane protein [Leptospira broomii serovar Hurstbridge str. 5399]|uniref:Membrane protein n=1 Tax=Leptospira broomii serovar Hurstbridge str. 5399 TaxID=1049789 RepID=T0GB20_9LEPT|nr:histidine kinase N-terminal 7TM domain-containing protein [Leptospira broomii]EQA44024.1 putative membrane protein [Leptospira broomii serovar Hurstbridge str. 5399]
MALFSSILLFASAYYFYKWSDRNNLCKTYALLTFTISLWCLLMFLGQLPFPAQFRILIVNFTPIPTLFVPLCATYIVLNYTRPNDLVSPPKILTLLHSIAILGFSFLSLIGYVSPVYFEGDEVRFNASVSYFFVIGYIYFSLFISLGVIAYNLIFGNYFVRLHSIYLFAGIVLASIVSSIFLVFLPLLGIYLNSLSAIGMLGFLWLSWIPIAKYRLFNVELTEFGQDFRNPKLSSVIITINRYLLNWMDPKAFKEICDQFELRRSEEIFGIQAEFILETAYNGENMTEQTRKFSKKVTNIFLK